MSQKISFWGIAFMIWLIGVSILIAVLFILVWNVAYSQEDYGLTFKYLWVAPNGTQYTCDLDENDTLIGCTPNFVIPTQLDPELELEIECYMLHGDWIDHICWIPMEGA